MCWVAVNCDPPWLPGSWPVSACRTQWLLVFAAVHTHIHTLNTWKHGHLVAWQTLSLPGCLPFWRGCSDSWAAAGQKGHSLEWSITAANGQAHCARNQEERRVQVGESQCQECALRFITKREAGSTAREKPMSNLHRSPFPLPPPFPSPSSHFPLLYPVLHGRLALLSLEFNPNAEEEASAPVKWGPSPTSSAGCSPKTLWQRHCCSLLNTNYAEKLPRTWVESWFPQTLQAFPRSWKDY